MCILTTTACSAILILYGMAFGNTTSKIWLITIFLSLFKDIFAIQPVKIFLISFVSSILWKKINVQDESDIQMQIKIQAVEELFAENNISHETTQDYLDADTNPSVVVPIEGIHNVAPSLPSKEELEYARNAALKKNKLRNLIMDLFTYIVFVILALQIPSTSFNEIQSIKEAFDMSGGATSNHSITFDQVK